MAAAKSGPRGELATRARMARIVGVAATTLDEWVKRGCPVHRPAPGRGAAAGFDTAAVVAWRVKEAAGGAGGLSLDRERARLAKWQADLAELRAGQVRGGLVEADLVGRAVTSAFTRVRSRLLALPSRAAPRLVGKANAAEVQALLDALVHEALSELADTKVVLAGTREPPRDAPGWSREKGEGGGG